MITLALTYLYRYYKNDFLWTIIMILLKHLKHNFTLSGLTNLENASAIRFEMWKF